MTTDNRKLLVSEDGFEAFVLSLALGTLETIRSNAWNPDSGIWTIGRPNFKAVMAKLSFPENVKAALEQMDELSAIQDLCGRDAYARHLDESIGVLTQRLKELSERYWCVRFENEPHHVDEHKTLMDDQ